MGILIYICWIYFFVVMLSFIKYTNICNVLFILVLGMSFLNILSGIFNKKNL